MPDSNTLANLNKKHHPIFGKNYSTPNLQKLQNLNSAIQPNNQQDKINQFLNQQLFSSIVGPLSGSQVNQSASQLYSQIPNNP